jgi:hypothetical protein
MYVIYIYELVIEVYQYILYLDQSLYNYGQNWTVNQQAIHDKKNGQHAQKSNSSIITHDQFEKMLHANLKLPKVQQNYMIVHSSSYYKMSK